MAVEADGTPGGEGAGAGAGRVWTTGVAARKPKTMRAFIFAQGADRYPN